MLIVDSRNTVDVWRNVCEFAKELKVAHKERQQVYHQLFQPGYQRQRPPGTLHSEVSRNINLPLPARPPRVPAVNNRQSSGLYGPAVLCFAFKTVIGIFGRSVKLLTARDAPHRTAPHQANSSDGNKAVRKGAELGCNQIKSRKLLEKSRKAQTHSQKIQPD